MIEQSVSRASNTHEPHLYGSRAVQVIFMVIAGNTHGLYE